MSPDMDFGPTHVDTALSMAKALRDVRKATSAPVPPKPEAAVPRPRPTRPDLSFRSYAHLSPCTNRPRPSRESFTDEDSSAEVVADVITITKPLIASPAPARVAPLPTRPTMPTPTAFVSATPSDDTARRLFSPFFAPAGPIATTASSPATDTQTAFAALDDDAAVLAMRPRHSGGLVGGALLVVGLAAGVLFGASFAGPAPKGAAGAHLAAATLIPPKSPVAATPVLPAPVDDRTLAHAAESPKTNLELPSSPPPQKRASAAPKAKARAVSPPPITASPPAPTTQARPTPDGDTNAATKLLEASRAATENTL